MQNFKQFFIKLGIQERFQRSAFISVLTNLKRRHAGGLPEKELEFTVRLLQHISKLDIEPNQEEVLVPRSDTILCPVSSLLFNDAPWLSSAMNEENEKFVHPNIGNELAQQLGVCVYVAYVYVCMCVCVNVYVYVCMYVYMCVCMYMCVRVCMCF